VARTAIGRLSEAKELDKIADGLKVRDPANSRKIQEKANALRNSAVRQLGRKPKKKKGQVGAHVVASGDGIGPASTPIKLN